MGFGESIKHVFSNMTNFSGRASRSEFWWFYLFIVIVGSILSIIVRTTAGSSGTGMVNFLMGIVYVILVLASLSVSVRRLHDSNKSGWLVLLNLLCCIGPIILIIFWVQPSTEGDNSYGPRPTA
ncbi:MAG: DUF805 domain-containing protein [Actinomycetes bacterium]